MILRLMERAEGNHSAGCEKSAASRMFRRVLIVVASEGESLLTAKSTSIRVIVLSIRKVSCESLSVRSISERV